MPEGPEGSSSSPSSSSGPSVGVPAQPASDFTTRTVYSSSGSPEWIGPYRVLGQIGAGGMGVVYEAEQEKPVRRKVALKLIRWGLESRELVARFESERQALALMNHASIARVLDAGAGDSPAGRVRGGDGSAGDSDRARA